MCRDAGHDAVVAIVMHEKSPHTSALFHFDTLHTTAIKMAKNKAPGRTDRAADLRVMEGERDCRPERRSSERCGA